jgi:hypothetical protein
VSYDGTSFILLDEGGEDLTRLASVIGAPSVSTETLEKLITDLQAKKHTLASNLTAKGQASVGTETLTALASKVGQISSESIKGVQRRYSTMNTNAVLTINIASVDLTKSVVIIKQSGNVNVHWRVIEFN